MNDAPGISHVAQLLADRARAAIVWTLIDGTSRPAGELAYAANISAQSASSHLAKLVRGGMLATEAQGRHRYFRIASTEVAAIVEAMASLTAAVRPRSPRSVLPPATPVQFLHSRTCYGHLAGEMAVRILSALLEARWLTPIRVAATPGSRGRTAQPTVAMSDYAVTTTGEARLSALGIDCDALRSERRVFARACVDLTERRAHLGGALGEALLDVYITRGWVQRQRRSRAVNITPKGEESFSRVFGV
jgi:DNA-binding transcriptional ArsR family regulator